jgi:glycosyltransferase involved in cell wall biosynthesis
MKDLSILIPARNEEFLKRTIEDILSNIEADTEIITVLDGYETELPNDRRLRVIYNPESIGQRAGTNQACRLSKAKYVMKCDAHCAFDKGFDRKMLEAFKEVGDNVTMVPTMRNLHVFNWVCEDGHSRYQSPSGPCKTILPSGAECGKPTKKDIVWIPKKRPESNSYCFDSEPHFQYFNEYTKRPGYGVDLSESMSLQGSCFMLTRDKYWELNISDENLGSWGSQGIEVACKTWLSGGRVLVNRRTWYGHMFRTQGGDFGFPYPISGIQTNHAKKTVRELFFDNKWEGQIHPLSWLLEKFWPVPGWTDEQLATLKAWPLQNGKNVSKEKDILQKTPALQIQKVKNLAPAPQTSVKPQSEIIPEEIKKQTAGIVYYTDNQLDENIMKKCQKRILKSALPIVSVSLKPIEFGENIVLPLERGFLTMFKQILAGLEKLDTDVVFLCDHDVLYHQSHFAFRPSKKDVYYYNMNSWMLRASDGHAVYYDCKKLQNLCADRKFLVEHYKKRVAMVEKNGFSSRMGFEPGTHDRSERVDDFKAGEWRSELPNVDIKHGQNLTTARWKQSEFRDQKNCQNWQEADEIPAWGKGSSILS